MDDKLQGRRIMLIGGAGFIGHHLALRLRSAGAEVTILDGLQVNNLLAFADTSAAGEDDGYLAILHERLQVLRAAGVVLHVVDAREAEAVREQVRTFGPQAVVHLAGISHAVQSDRDPAAAFDHTLRTVQCALDASRGIAERFVFFSSSMVYGHFDGETVDEAAPCDPLGIYGTLKLAGEGLVRAYQRICDLPFTIIRPSALYGERCVSRRIIQIFVESALRGRPLRITGDGSDRLDFTYIDDLIDGIVSVLTHSNAINETFNLTHGAGRSIAELAALVSAAFPGIAIERDPRPRLMPRRGTLVVDKARSLIGYAPKWPLELGLPRYVDWYRTFLASSGVTPAEVVRAARAVVRT